MCNGHLSQLSFSLYISCLCFCCLYETDCIAGLHAPCGVAAAVIVSAGGEKKTSRVCWKVTKHNRTMSLRTSGHRGVGNSSTLAEEDAKVYI